jgi:hypothetical protein
MITKWKIISPFYYNQVTKPTAKLMGAEVVEEEKGGHRMARKAVQEGNLEKVRDFVGRWWLVWKVVDYGWDCENYFEVDSVRIILRWEYFAMREENGKCDGSDILDIVNYFNSKLLTDMTQKQSTIVNDY